ncbi:ribosome-associated translation inhibitor RaiA [Candidatus Peregrinibacteria bacterium]|nr:ribosome-associated translation inhibitor RaiA [Candidatus Peregrinibacteria bacterium]
MQIKIKSQNLSLSDAQKELIKSKVEKLKNFADRLDDESAEFRVEVRHEKARKTEDAYACQLTIFAPNAVLRAESREESIENAVDDCLDKIHKPIERYKAKIHRSEKKGLGAKELEETKKPSDEFEIPKVLRRKRFSANAPMTEEEAIERMEMIGHSFFLFNNMDTHRFSVIYKRSDGYYGIIEPKMDND